MSLIDLDYIKKHLPPFSMRPPIMLDLIHEIERLKQERDELQAKLEKLNGK